MARGKMGAFMTDIKGSVGGTSFQGSRSGLSIKNKGQKPKVGVRGWDSAFVSRKINFSTIAKLWGTLTDAQRLGWSNLLGTWQFINKFGDTYNGSAFQIFTACNLNRIALGLTPLNDVPAVNPAFDPELTFSDFQIGATTFNRIIAGAAAQGQYAFLSFSNVVNPSVGYPRTKALVSFPALIPAPATINWYSVISLIPGFVPVAGKVFYIRMWTAWADYPKKSFETIYKINIVA